MRMRSIPPAWLLVLTWLTALEAANTWHACWTLNYKWTGTQPLPTTVDSAPACAKLCNETSGGACAHFSYYQFKCILGRSTDSLEYSDGHISGPSYPDCTCPSMGPVNGVFPALTDVASQLAWRNGRQPAPLSCWPTGAALEPCLKEPLPIFDTAQNSWGGDCLGGMQTVQATDEAHCQQQCTSNPLCPSWRFNADGSCLHGLGERCQGAGTGIARAQRLIHGRVRLLQTLTQHEVVGLKKVFDASYYSDSVAAAKDCQYTCYSSIYCQVWQYLTDVPVGHGGCYIEDPLSSAAASYPLSLEAGNVKVSTSVVAGEFIQHYCGKARNAQPATDLSFKSHPEPAPIVEAPAISAVAASLMGITLLFCSCTMVMAFWLRHKPPKSPGTKRSLKAKRSLLPQGPSSSVTTYPVSLTPQVQSAQPIQYQQQLVQYAQPSYQAYPSNPTGGYQAYPSNPPGGYQAYPSNPPGGYQGYPSNPPGYASFPAARGGY